MTTRDTIAALIKNGWNLPGIAFVLNVKIETVREVWEKMKRGAFKGELFVLTYVIPTKPSRPFEVGDLVDVMDREGKWMSTQRVMRAGKGTLKTRCGRTWTQRGFWKGENGSWPFPWIRHSRRKTEMKARMK